MFISILTNRQDFTPLSNPFIIKSVKKSFYIAVCAEGGRMYEMPTNPPYKDELRKEEIRIEPELEMLNNKDYEQLGKS